MLKITARHELVELARQLGVREDWHEVDKQGVSVDIRAADYQAFTNALTPGDGNEAHAAIRQNGRLVAVVNLATLFAFATGYEGQ